MGRLGNHPKLLVLRSWDETLSFLTVCGFGRYIRLYAGWLGRCGGVSGIQGKVGRRIKA